MIFVSHHLFTNKKTKMFQTRVRTACGPSSWITIDKNEYKRERVKTALEILDTVPGLAKIIIGCYNYAKFDEYIRNPPLEGSLNLNDQDKIKYTEKLINVYNIEDQGWCVEFHPSLESKTTQFKASAYDNIQ